MITSPHNEKLKRIRRLHKRRERERSGLFVAEGEDLVDAAAAAGVEPELLLVADVDVEAPLLDSVSALGSGTRVIAVYRQRWAPAPVGSAGEGSPGTTASVSVYLQGVRDPGNVGTIIRTGHALCDGPVVLGPECADPYSPKAVRASMGSVFARPPARAELAELAGMKMALDAGADASIAELDLAPPVVVCVGAERAGLAADVKSSTEATVRIPMRSDGPDSLNAAAAVAVALHELANRMAGHA